MYVQNMGILLLISSLSYVFLVSAKEDIEKKHISFKNSLSEHTSDEPDSRNVGQIRFEDGQTFHSHDLQPDKFTFSQTNRYLPESYLDSNYPSNTKITFQDDNKIEAQVLKKRRRRRKPRYQGYPGFQAMHAFQNIPGTLPTSYPNIPAGQRPFPGVGGPALPYPASLKPLRIPESFASEALSRVTEALTLIALYDDYQCVPRLLCEAAGGGALGAAGNLPSLSGLQPLLTLLAAYNGISASPLFLFGRAVFLGMTSKGNTGSCRYAFPQCPTDTEQLVHYLNNHNGGFFRFFNSPPAQQQNLQQFYNQLSLPGQQQSSHKLYQSPNHNYLEAQSQQGYGLLPQNFGQNHYPNNYGLYSPTYPNQYPQSYETNNHYYPGVHNNYGYQQNNAQKYPGVFYKSNSYEESDKKLERRIQNKPNTAYIETDIENVRDDNILTFPDDKAIDDKPAYIRTEKALKFPDANIIDHKITLRDGKAIKFPESNINTASFNNNNYDIGKYYLGSLSAHPKDSERDTIYTRYYPNNNSHDNGLETVYIVRGNGDPNNPEIVKLRPGQILSY